MAEKMMPTERVYPILLAAGPPRGLPFPKALAPFEGKTALGIAVEVCRSAAGLGAPIVVLGCQARRVKTAMRRLRLVIGRPAIVVVTNSRWRNGQITSLVAGMRRLPRDAAGFLLYPVDYPLVRARLVDRLLRRFYRRGAGQQIVAPAIGPRTGHPILVARALIPEFRACERRGGTAREVIYRKTQPDRMARVAVRDRAIHVDFDSQASYQRCLRALRRQSAERSVMRTCRRKT